MKDRIQHSTFNIQHSSSAPGKLFLCGEHAVVYRRPAIAIPVPGVRAFVTIAAGRPGSGVQLDAIDMDRRWSLAEAADDPLSQLVLTVLEGFGAGQPDLQISIRSDIPIASGMGSGAAIGTALVRALAAQYGQQLSPAEVSALVYISEQGYHGTPSGIDNTVVAYEQPIWFVRQPEGQPAHIEPVQIKRPLHILIADTGVRSATKLPVAELRRRWQGEPAHYEALFDAIAAIALNMRLVLQDVKGDPGPLLSENHRLLQAIGVSSPELDRLVDAALAAGAAGAKLSGAGWGGVILALVNPERQEAVREALLAAGAVRVLATELT